MFLYYLNCMSIAIGQLANLSVHVTGSAVSRDNVLHYAVQQNDPNVEAVRILVNNGANL